MKRFLLKFLLFLLPLIFIAAFTEWKLSQLPNTYSQKKADLERQLSDIQILVLGPSHALHGIDPAFFSQKGFNLANASQTLFYDRALTLHYLDQMPRLRLVVIPVSYNSLYTQLADSKENFREWFYAKYWHVETPDMPKLNLNRYSYIALYTPQTAFDFAIKGFKVDLVEGLAANGYLRYDTTDCLRNISYTLGAKRVELYRRMMKEEHYSENVDILTDLVSALRQRNIQVCFVTTPVYKTFARYCEPAILSANMQALRDICYQHGCGYKNYFTDPRFDITDFYDNDHLNFIGAEHFTQILDSEVINKVNFH